MVIAAHGIMAEPNRHLSFCRTAHMVTEKVDSGGPAERALDRQRRRTLFFKNSQKFKKSHHSPLNDWNQISMQQGHVHGDKETLHRAIGRCSWKYVMIAVRLHTMMPY